MNFVQLFAVKRGYAVNIVGMFQENAKVYIFVPEHYDPDSLQFTTRKKNDASVKRTIANHMFF